MDDLKRQRLRTWFVIAGVSALVLLLLASWGVSLYDGYQARKEEERKQDILRRAAPLVAKKRAEQARRKAEAKREQERLEKIQQVREEREKARRRAERAARPKMPDIELDRTYPVNGGFPVCISEEAIHRAIKYINLGDHAAFRQMVNQRLCSVTEKDRLVYIDHLEGQYIAVRPRGHDALLWVHRETLMRSEY